uniref:Capsid protein n=1 Tax=Syrmaticus reevesii Genomoviridae sp. TaxID=2814996 RepID=A0A8E7G232_9VIRU|nr:MAG: capsid protein [Gemycircularvirus]
MAYGRSKSTRSRRSSKRTTRKKSYLRLRRFYDKKRMPRRSVVSKRRILNIASTKKRNGMLSWSNTSNTGASQTIGINTAYVNGGPGAPAHFLFLPTAMNMLDNSGTTDNPVNSAQRTSTTCYMRGFSERIRIQTSSAVPWFHRRICFTTRGISPFNTLNTKDTLTQQFGSSADTSNGMERAWYNCTINTMDNTIADRYGILFKGQQNKDWNDHFLAPVDTQRVDLKFDKTWVIKTGNQNGALIERKLWHPMNKNIVYDDDEQGEVQASSYYSTDSKQGMGDYYILDLFQPGLGATANDILNVFSNSTLYWHEK